MACGSVENSFKQLYYRFRKKYLHKVHESQIIRRLLKPGWLSADVGANEGYHTLCMAHCVGSTGKVFSFEPDPFNFSLLSNQVNKYGFQNVRLIQKAVSNRVGQVQFYLHKQNKGSHSFFGSNHLSLFNEKPILVEAITLDQFLKSYDYKLDYLKMDIEGAEILALKGAQKVLRKNKELIIFLEYNPEVLLRSGQNPMNLLDLLQESGFYYFYKAHGNMKALKKVMKSEIFELKAGLYWNIVCSKNGLVPRY